MTQYRTSIVVVVAVFAVTSVLGAPVRPSAGIERGHIFAREHCATCHAIERSGASPYAPAPPFRTLHERYDVDGLAEALVEGIVVGHTGPRQMPRFVISPSEADDLISYLKSLESPLAPRRAPAVPKNGANVSR
jgi:cytochrome c